VEVDEEEWEEGYNLWREEEGTEVNIRFKWVLPCVCLSLDRSVL